MDVANYTPDNQQIATARSIFYIYLGGSIDGLALETEPLEDVSQIRGLRQAAFSLKDHIADDTALSEEAGVRLKWLLAKSNRFSESATFHNRVANLHAALGDIQMEKVSLERAFDISSSNFFKQRWAESLLRRNSLDEAASIFDALSAAPENNRALLGMAAVCVRRGDYVGAREWVDQLCSRGDQSFDLKIFSSGLDLIEGRFSQAISNLRHALSIRENSSVAYSNMGIAFLNLGQAEKAFNSFKRANTLDPFNRTALIALADIGCSLGKNDDAISPLRYYVRFEQKDAGVWSKIARSLFGMRMYRECVDALHNQGAVAESVEVWNNLGVCYSALGDKEKAFRCLRHSLTKVEADDNRSVWMVARNSCQLLAENKSPQDVLKATDYLLEGDSVFELAKTEHISDILLMRLQALESLGRRLEAISLAEEVLTADRVDPKLQRELLIALIGSYGLLGIKLERLNSLIDFSNNLVRSEVFSSADRLRLANNVAFAFAETGRQEDALKMIQSVADRLHKDAYLTATFGLICIKRGDLERGVGLYREAVGLAPRLLDKNRIRQKLNLEMAKAFAANHDYVRARRALDKATTIRGDVELKRQAERLLTRIPMVFSH